MDSNVRNVKVSKGFFLRKGHKKEVPPQSLQNLVVGEGEKTRHILARAVYFVGIWVLRGEGEMGKTIKSQAEKGQR